MKSFWRLSVVRIISCLLIGLLYTGCHKKPNPTPADTVLGSNLKKDRADYIDSKEVYGDELMLRDTMLSDDSKYTSTAHLENILASVYFKFDNTSIGPEERTKLARLAEQFKAEPNRTILVIGHCDVHGTPDYNLPLGWRRANSVVNYLTDLGISKSRIETLSRGDLDAKRTGSKEQTAPDRRCDIKFTN